MNYGLIIEERKPEDYVLGGFGSLPKDVLVEDGNWEKHLPEGEIQNKNNVEPSACVSFSLLNCLEILANRIEKKENFSDRFLAWNSDTGSSGNTINRVVETLRKAGTPNEKEWPVDNSVKTFEDYYKSPPPKLFELARKHFLDKYDFYHEWVDTNKKDLMEALKYSPLQVSVFAWKDDGQYYIKPRGAVDNHATVLYGYKEGEYWLIFDSYYGTGGGVCKKLAWDYKFGQVKRFRLVAKEGKVSFWSNLIGFFSDLISLYTRPRY